MILDEKSLPNFKKSMTTETKIERRNKILKGLEKAYEKMLDFKKSVKVSL